MDSTFFSKLRSQMAELGANFEALESADNDSIRNLVSNIMPLSKRLFEECKADEFSLKTEYEMSLNVDESTVGMLISKGRYGKVYSNIADHEERLLPDQFGHFVTYKAVSTSRAILLSRLKSTEDGYFFAGKMQLLHFGSCLRDFPGSGSAIYALADPLTRKGRKSYYNINRFTDVRKFAFYPKSILFPHERILLWKKHN